MTLAEALNQIRAWCDRSRGEPIEIAPGITGSFQSRGSVRNSRASRNGSTAQRLNGMFSVFCWQMVGGRETIRSTFTPNRSYFGVAMTSTVRFQCPSCQSILEAPSVRAGDTITCLKCRHRLQVPHHPPVAQVPPGLPAHEEGNSQQAPTTDAICAQAGTAAAQASSRPYDFGDDDGGVPARALKDKLVNQPADHARALLKSLRDTGGLGRLLEWRRIPLANTLWPALVLFFLPWTNLSCNDHVVVHQSGLQSCYGGFTPSAQLRRMMERNQMVGQPAPPPGRPGPERLPIAPFTIPFAAFLALGLVAGLACVVGVAARFRASGAGLHLLALGCGSVCFVLLVAQMIFGFPLDRQIQQNAERIRQQRQVARNNPIGNPFGNPFGNPKAGADIAAEAMLGVDVQYSAWFWLTLLLTFLSVPLLIMEAIVALVGATSRGLLVAGTLTAVFIGACVISVGTSYGVTEFVLNNGDPAAPNPVLNPIFNQPGPVPQNPFPPVVIQPPAPAGKLLLRKQGRLMPNDPVREGKPMQSFPIDMKKGKTYVIDLQSTEMDAYLYLFDPGNLKVAQDDDSGGMLNARIRFTANRSGVYTIGCSVLAAVRNGGANFTLAVHEE